MHLIVFDLDLGYGVIAPKTMWGQLVCIAYALIGIPLMILCLATVGDVMAKIFRYVYSMVCCCGCCRYQPKKKVRTTHIHLLIRSCPNFSSFTFTCYSILLLVFASFISHTGKYI